MQGRKKNERIGCLKCPPRQKKIENRREDLGRNKISTEPAVTKGSLLQELKAFDNIFDMLDVHGAVLRRTKRMQSRMEIVV